MPLYIRAHPSDGPGRIELVPGIRLELPVGSLAEHCEKAITDAGFRHRFAPSHILIIDSGAYAKGCAARIHAEGIPNRPLDVPYAIIPRDIVRQMATSLYLACGWTTRYCVTIGFRRDPELPTSKPCGVGDTDFCQPGDDSILGWGDSSTGEHEVAATFLDLDRYYRAGVWSTDRIAVALNMLHCGLYGNFVESRFISLVTAVEALVQTKQGSGMNRIRSRVASLFKADEAFATFDHEDREVFDELFRVRNTIVHGDSEVLVNRMVAGHTYFSAKGVRIESQHIQQMAILVRRLLRVVLRNGVYRSILVRRQPPAHEESAINDYFALSSA